MNPAAHVAQLLEQSPDLAGAVAKAAECSVPLLQRAMDDYGLLSPLQWAQIAECAEVPATWLGSGEPWHPDMIRALQRNSRAKASSVELQRLRRGNLRRLADACTHTTHLATLLNTAPSMLSDLMNSETRAASQRRAFGPRRARAMEDALGLPDGWLDRDEPVPPALGMRARQLSSAPRTRAIAARGPSVGGAAGLGDWPLPTAVAPIHQTVLAKYLDLAKAGVVDEAFAYSLLGTLLDKERPPGAAVAAITG
ncbi:MULTISPECIES: hypothetical protein [unclassified Variovorax]|uniref:hypothetical protein n=1 Tax=unclassified Variovorax TaxID=663243 RepID=UPI000838538F|nr:MULTISPECIES: hypothetical protein [unclassified Variovorax]PNG49856.1 hypothetical protein CHC06_05437 [Variovorax sp. B2]PNG50728.1 hypothetical protein CHC07_05342 [Variovorax sp. B4]VTV17935.1 hypothetical protein WDL1P1_00777 [Variovorax sp. WDL1]